MRTFFDDFENKATIVCIKTFPYKDATKRVDTYRLTPYSLYNDGLMYHLSHYETEKDALNALKEFSCGTFKEGGHESVR